MLSELNGNGATSVATPTDSAQWPFAELAQFELDRYSIALMEEDFCREHL